MEVVNPHSLFDDKIKKIIPSPDMIKLFNSWRKLMFEKSDNISEMDFFMAGYFFGTNSNLRLRFKKLYDIENYDNRIKDPLHDIKNNEV